MKRDPRLRDLSDDHHTGLVLARRCKQATRAKSASPPDAVWAELRAVFVRDLEPHFRIEEQHLVPALEAIGEAALASRIREDHDALRSLRDSEAATAAELQRFGELLQAHIRFEERQIFDPTQDRLPPSALEAIARACRDERQASGRSCNVEAARPR